ncbi:NADPH:quinone reductase [Salinispira pacifica]|uniref:Quinone oxidoreductase n=1 Tax=Salinispira pacifica TaxID=1307761 RepID=V5WL93_9SPIO|nr:NADPH:quinone reductase [Salinispira pacifica]AHC16587.1 Quinone oxidoreductase [Salinispira pacifica]
MNAKNGNFRMMVNSYGGPEVLTLQEQEPPAPGPGEVLVRLSFAGVNPVDGYRRSGSQGYTPDLPFCPGFEGAGHIEAVGPRCSDQLEAGLNIGDPVYVAWSGTGTYAGWCIADCSQVFPVPRGMELSRAAGLFVNYFTAYRALVFRGSVLPTDRVFIHGGSGGVGMAAIQWCGFLGNEVWATAGSSEGLELLRQQGVEHRFNHGREGYGEEIRSQRPEGFDLILEMRADINLDRDLDLLAPGGRVMIIGSRGETSLVPRKTMGKELDIRGVVLMGNSPDANRSIHRSIEKGCASEDILPVIQQIYPLSEAAQAHREMEEHKALGKRILDCRPV